MSQILLVLAFAGMFVVHEVESIPVPQFDLFNTAQNAAAGYHEIPGSAGSVGVGSPSAFFYLMCGEGCAGRRGRR